MDINIVFILFFVINFEITAFAFYMWYNNRQKGRSFLLWNLSLFMLQIGLFILLLTGSQTVYCSLETFIITFSVCVAFNLGHILFTGSMRQQNLEMKIVGIEQQLREAEETAVTDELTGLRNRRFFNERVYVDIERADRYGHKLSIITLDLDHFKEVNDTFGHDVGDLVLKEVADILVENTRKSDLVARWGGEEFVILAFETDKHQTETIAEKIRKEIEKHIFEFDIRMTVSLGIAIRIPGENYSSWFKKADEALYEAKNKGRNQYVVCESVSNIEEQLASLHWENRFESGEAQIDLEHQRLVELLREIYKGDQSDELLLIKAKKLIDYVKEHFESEESILERDGYPRLAEHKKIHKRLIKKAELIISKINSAEEIQGESVAYVLKELILDHLINADMDFVRYYSSNSLL